MFVLGVAPGCFVLKPNVWQDLRRCGSSLADILKAGQWKSAAFLNYIDEMALQEDLAYAAAIHSEEEWID
jgi:hypothetical protein